MKIGQVYEIQPSWAQFEVCNYISFYHPEFKIGSKVLILETGLFDDSSIIGVTKVKINDIIVDIVNSELVDMIGYFIDQSDVDEGVLKLVGEVS